jgi:hypothetical protein
VTTENGAFSADPTQTPAGPTAWFELSARLGDIGRGVGQLVADGRQDRAVPVQAVQRKGGDVPASGTVTIDFGSPAMGRRWTVKSLAVAPAGGIGGTLAGSAAWYVGQPGAFGAGEWCAPVMATLPAFTFVGADQVWVTPNDHLFCVITGGTSGQSALARAGILEYPLYTGAPVIEL